MKSREPSSPHTLRRVAALATFAALTFSACGTDAEPVSTDSTSEEAPTGETGAAVENGIEDAAEDTPADAGLDQGDTVANTDADKDANGELEDYEEAIAEGVDDPATDYIQPIEEPIDDETAAAWQRLITADIIAPGDIVDPKPWVIDEAIVLSADSTEILVRYTAGNAPCTQSRATVVETDDTIEVGLEVGLHPNVAAMSCLAGTSGSEVALPLANPAGSRVVVVIQP